MKIDIYNTDKKYNREVAIGKAGEYLVCACLLKQGYDCFLSAYELPYDILVEKDGKVYKIQVKTVTKPITTKKQKEIYRFGLRHGKGNLKRFEKYDYFAFVALDIMKVAFLSKEQLLNNKNEIKTIVEFKSKDNQDFNKKSKYIEDFQIINIKKEGGMA